MAGTFNSDEISNDNVEIVEENGDLIQRHIPTGAELKFDSDVNAWVPVQGLDMQGSGIANPKLAGDLDAGGNSLTNVAAVEADEVSNGGNPVSFPDPLSTGGGSGTTDDEIVNFGGGAFSLRWGGNSVGTSSTTLIEDVAVTVGGPIWVGGRDSTDEFIDEVVVTRGGPANDTELHTRNTPSSRSYSVTNTDDLSLAMGSGTYDVGLVGFAWNLSQL